MILELNLFKIGNRFPSQFLEEIEKINLMNESDFNRLPEKRFISIISESIQSYPQTLLSLERKKESESKFGFS